MDFFCNPYYPGTAIAAPVFIIIIMGGKKIYMGKIQNFLNWLSNHPKTFLTILFLLLSLIIEILYNYFHIEVLFIFFSIISIFLLSPIKKELINLSKKTNKTTKNKHKSLSIYESLETSKVSFNKNSPTDNAIKIVINYFFNILEKIMCAWKDGKIIIMLVILLLSFTSSVAAYNHLWGTAFHEIGQFFFHMSEGSTPDNKPEINNKPNNNIYKEKDTQLGFLTNPNCLITLSEDETMWLYFKNKDISNSDNARNVAQKILQFLHSEILSQQLTSNFDETSPNYIQEMIEKASIRESSMQNSDDLDTIITMRSNVWDNNYKAYTIAYLLANNMQQYAQEYFKINGQFETIKYYYAYSVFWSWRSLTLESVSQYDFTKTLYYIAMRYRDIAYVAPDDSQEKQQAMLIANALEIIIEETNYEAIKDGVAIIWQ